MNYAPGTPSDKNNYPKIGYAPAKVALASTTKEATLVSSVLQFTHNTTELEITTVGVGVAAKWTGAATPSVVAVVSGANFDFIVPVATTRRFVIPQSVVGNYSSVQGVNRAEGLYQGIAYIGIGTGIGSVLTAEF